MAFWKWCLCLSFLAVAVCDNSFENFQDVEITNVTLLPHHRKEFPDIKDLLIKLSAKSEKEQIAEINQYVDDLLKNLNEYILSTGLDPIPLPGIEENFRWTVFFGWVGLYDGWLRGLASMDRQGDAIVEYEYPNVKVHLVLGFANLGFDYQYAAKLWGLGPSGVADGKAKGSKFTVDLEMNMVNLRATLNKFRLNTLGKVSLKFHGGITADMANVLVAVVLPILKPILNIVLEGFINDGLQAILGTYNQFICRVLADCPEQLTNTVYQLLH